LFLTIKEAILKEQSFEYFDPAILYSSKKGITWLIISSILVTTNSAIERFSYLTTYPHLKKSTKLSNKSTSLKS